MTDTEVGPSPEGVSNFGKVVAGFSILGIAISASTQVADWVQTQVGLSNDGGVSLTV